jgi:tRNA dimethylallyltransferase
MNDVLPDLIIGGPTASGKTAVALAVAEACGGEIIGADAFQLYRGLPTLTAQPTPEERLRIPHHLIGEFDLSHSLDVTVYLQAVRDKIRKIRARDRIPILVGGTGLYIRTVLFGLAEGLPSPDPALRQELESRPLASLQQQLRELDPQAGREVDLRNPRRVVRALEVCLQSGQPFSSFRHNRTWDGPPAGIWLARPRAELHSRIEVRTARMFEDGVEMEVRDALPGIGVTASQVIGLKPIIEQIEGRFTQKETVAAIAQATRQYAKRQETWFRKEPSLSPTSAEEAVRAALAIIRGLGGKERHGSE